MDPATTPFVMSICIVGSLALSPLIIAFGLVGMLRKMIDWLEAR